MAAKIAGVLSSDLSDAINASKILVVGAGGIGCEILKNLVMSGFSEIEIIDLDTIDVSNLNRQFLFHKEHVGKSKAVVAKESALSFNPNVNITAYHDSITSLNFNIQFFKRFNLVLNALDNRQARNHVNRMCLTADIPLIESGTAGYNGQVELIKKGLTQCYECTPKAAQKSYPGCTIRNTPSEPIHCIVWSKHLFNQLFGENNADEDVSPDTADPEASADAGADALTTESNEKGNVERFSTRTWAQNCKYDPEKLFNKLFHDDIKYLLSMANLWKNRVPPKPLKWNDLAQPGTSDKQNTNVLPDQKIWNLQECAKIFAQSVDSLKESFYKLAEGDHLVWDKDDKYAMDFVASCANIRSYIYNIQQKSRFDVKSMAGNIIPAIATTNAITAGFVVMHAFNVLLNNYEKCNSVYMRLGPNGRNQLFVPEKTSIKPNPKCYVCSPKPEIAIKIDTKKLTVKEFNDEVLVKSLNMVYPDVMSNETIIISSEEGETDDNNNKTLHDMGVVDGCVLLVDDFFQHYVLSVTIIHHTAERDEPDFEVIADAEMLKPKKDNGNEEAIVESNETSDNIEMLEEKENATTNNEEKVENLIISLNDDDEVVAAKKARPNDEDDDCCIISDSDAENDVIEVPLAASRSQSPQNSNRNKVKKHKLFDMETGESPHKRARIEINSDDDDEDDDFDDFNDDGGDDDVITLD